MTGAQDAAKPAGLSRDTAVTAPPTLPAPDGDIVVFDGVCNLCTGAVRFILAHEATPVSRFVALQSPAGARLLRHYGFDPGDARTFVLVSEGRAFSRSDAALRLLGFLRPPWPLLRALRFIPRPVRDWAYDRVARNRYHWFGRRTECLVPTPELRARFIEEATGG